VARAAARGYVDADAHANLDAGAYTDLDADAHANLDPDTHANLDGHAKANAECERLSDRGGLCVEILEAPILRVRPDERSRFNCSGGDGIQRTGG
jgi:hypothetical protein